MGIGDINASHLGPTKPLVPLTGVPTHPTTVPSITDEQQQKSIQEQRDARPLKRIQEEKLEQQAKEKEEMEKEEKQLDVELLHDDLVLKNDDTELELIESVRSTSLTKKILLELHAQWYEGFDTEKTKYAQAEFVTSRPDVKVRGILLTKECASSNEERGAERLWPCIFRADSLGPRTRNVRCYATLIIVLLFGPWRKILAPNATKIWRRT